MRCSFAPKLIDFLYFCIKEVCKDIHITVVITTMAMTIIIIYHYYLSPPPPPCGSPHITVPIKASMHVEQDPCRREAVPHPGRRRVAGCGGGEVRPGLSDGIVHVQVVEDVSCARRTRDASSELTNATCNKHNDKGTPHHQHKRTNPDAPTKPLSLITVIIVTARIDLTAGLFSLCLADR